MNRTAADHVVTWHRVQTGPIAKPASKHKWAAKCRVRSSHLRALSLWHQSQQQMREAEAHGGGKGFGLEIAMLNAASEACTTTIAGLRTGGAITVSPTPQELQRTIQARLDVRTLYCHTTLAAVAV